jgi:hypothetical protein
VSFAAFVRLNSCVVDIYKNSLWFEPAFGNFLDIASQAIASSMELQMNGLIMLTPLFLSHASAGSSGNQSQPAAEELAASIDIAIGAQFTVSGSTVETISGAQARPVKEVEETESMSMAIGA